MGVKLREKPLKGGGVSFYLDISHAGKRWYQFLDIRTYAARSNDEFKEKFRLAKKARSTKEYQLSCDKNKLTDETKQQQDFYAFILERTAVLKVNRVYRSMINRLKDYSGKEFLPIDDVTKEFLLGFQEYLKKRGMMTGTVYSTVHRLSTFINKAVECGYMDHNPYHMIPKTQRVKLKRRTPNYLTLEQIELLAKNSEGIPEQLKLAFFFSCFTGLRWSDCSRLKWSQIVRQKMDDKQVTVLRIQQIKTDHVTYLPLSAQALEILEARKNSDENNSPYVFPDLYEPDGERVKQSAGQFMMKRWRKQAGLERLYFHLSRHTFATLTLSQGADLYTVSKLLGHTDIKHTMVYAQVVDKLKLEAIARLPKLPGNFLGGIDQKRKVG